MKTSPTREMHPGEQTDLPEEAAKTMFEIYRETRPPYQAHVVYYTELQDYMHKKEIERAFTGDSIFSGFLWDRTKTDAKREITVFLEHLNNDQDLSPSAIAEGLRPYLA